MRTYQLPPMRPAWRLHRLAAETRQLRSSNATLVALVGDQIQQLISQQGDADSATLRRARYLAAASHDLGQPLQALKLHLGLIAAQLPPASGPALNQARHCAQTIDDMFRALLDMSRLDASAVHAELAVFPIGSVLERIHMEFAPQAQAKGLRLRTAPCSALTCSDPALLERILRNLVSNAVRYTVRGAILVGCRRGVDGLRLAVHDTGPGIAPDQQLTVFEAFYQIGAPGRERGVGMGLGLSIAQSLAHLLHTTVTLQSELARGTVFCIDLPRVSA
jgi:signal transduction histidine kinase